MFAKNALMTRRLLLALIALVVILAPAVALAQGIQNPIKGCNQLGECLAQLIRGVLALVGVLAVGFIVYGGLLYITAGGNDDQIRQGKNAITGAIVGIILVGLAFAIVEFVYRALGGDGGGPQIGG